MFYCLHYPERLENCSRRVYRVKLMMFPLIFRILFVSMATFTIDLFTFSTLPKWVKNEWKVQQKSLIVNHPFALKGRKESFDLRHKPIFHKSPIKTETKFGRINRIYIYVYTHIQFSTKFMCLVLAETSRGVFFNSLSPVNYSILTMESIFNIGHGVTNR